MDYLKSFESNVEEVCNECSHRSSERCNFRKCNIGFADYVIKNIKDNQTYSIDDGEDLIPKDDFKYYDEKVIAKGIANICRLCKECNENHNENCVIALTRRTLEYTQLKDKIAYPGNIILYLMNVSKQRPELAELIKQEYMRIG
ncbi:hypothetical protein JOC70_000219 [Clostridium pascui]|uniref:hypothetical protein n=1 Tax=Clostridium pascui TaxID=46609 RepID=UPI00195C023A|nr:hypothetical protein [Clostridium pascui]MBM7868750.1 hypothetical protein [Clostridium pascui]